MKCEKCGNEYNSQYYFSTPTVCNDCFRKLPAEEQQELYRQAAQGLVLGDGFSKRVGFGRRLGATLIDFGFNWIINGVIFYYSGFVQAYSDFFKAVMEAKNDTVLVAQLQKEFMSQNIDSMLFSLLISLVYFSLEIFVGSSLGKMILGIQIGQIDGYRANTGALTIRFVIKNIYYILLIVWLFSGIDIISTIGLLAYVIVIIGFFFTLSKKKLSFHDMIAKTAVYKKDAILEEAEA